MVPFFDRLVRAHTNAESEDWYRHAVEVLRGGDGGEHGLLLYDLACRASENEPHVIALDVGTARGFSALAMSRAIEGADVSGIVYSIDTIGHDEVVGWHGPKHHAEDPLASEQISRAEIWERWFPNEFSSVDVVTGRSVDVLRNWEHGSIAIAFLDGSHTYDDVSLELAMLDGRMARNGVVVVDDYHIGEVVGRVRSRLVNFLARLVARRLGRSSRRPPRFAPRLGESVEYRLVKQRFSGVRRAVDEFVADRYGCWSLEVVSMPTRGKYQGPDYSLAVLTRCGGAHTESIERRAGVG